jgi:transcriptional regulator with XRE-family HTH domain
VKSGGGVSADDMVYRARARAGLSLRALARRCGVSHVTLHRFENGEPEVMGEAAIRRVASCLGIDFIDIMCAVGRVPTIVVDLLSKRPDDVRRLWSEVGGS